MVKGKKRIVFFYRFVSLFRFPGGCSSHAGATPTPTTEEEEAEVRERQEEGDDPELLARRRAMDEFKDDHRRGEGNRHNRS